MERGERGRGREKAMGVGMTRPSWTEIDNLAGKCHGSRFVHECVEVNCKSDVIMSWYGLQLCCMIEPTNDVFAGVCFCCFCLINC